MPALIVSYTSHPGGAERILADHATAIGDDAIVACPPGWLADRLREQQVRVFPLRERPIELRGARTRAALRLAAHAREVKRLTDALRPHTVVAWGMRSLLACAAARPDARLVFQHNDLLAGGVAGRAVRRAATRADVVLALSQAIADDLGQPAVVIHPGVDLTRFHPGEARGDHALFLGALTPWKRPDLAMKASAEAGIDLVVGGQPLDDDGRDFADELRASAPSNVTFSGQIDPAEALRSAKLLIHAADKEPYGMALVEALACGTPVVAPDAGGPKEIVDDSCGRLYPPGDATHAAAAIRSVLADRDVLARGARARAEKHFDLSDSRRRYAEQFRHDPPNKKQGIAIVTVLHNSEEEVRALMASIDRHLPHARLIAVDSGSTDNGAQVVREWGGTVIDPGENVGYGRGTNIGVEAATEPVTIVLNPDVELLDSSLAALADEASRHSDRLLAPLVLLPDGRRQDNVHTERADLTRTIVPGNGGPWNADQPHRVTWAVGCALAAQTQTLQRLGPFDERIFLYAEDLDLGLRASEQGIETWFWPDARVLHKQAHSSEPEFMGEPFEMLARNRREVIQRRKGSATRDDLIQAATFANRIALKTLLRKPTTRERRQLEALRKARRDPPAR